MKSYDLKQAIKEKAFQLGFTAFGVAEAKEIDASSQRAFTKWIEEKKEAQMHYMTSYREKRFDPRLLVENARTVIVTALNYYPAKQPPPGNPRFAAYAYGKDYHEVVKNKLNELLLFINNLIPVQGRIFCDTAPILERYWAQQAGIGFIGKNTQLILPGKGSYFFLGEIISDLELPADTPVGQRCGTCMRCINLCPTQALIPGVFTTLDANRCLSCQTIENRENISPEIALKLNNRVYGCDTCMEVCPWNRFSTPTRIEEFIPSPEFMQLDKKNLECMTREDFNRIFRHSAVKRVKYDGLKRNIGLLKEESET